MVTPTWRVDVQLSVGVWTAITADVVAAEVCRLKYGIDGNGPTDCMASTGECSFALRNDARNSGSTQGWYSPAHGSKRVGWTYGIPFRVVFTYSAVDYTKFRGKLRVILPDAGTYRSQRVHVTGYDGAGDLMDADVRNVALQTSKTEAELLTALLDALPTDAQPIARSLDTGVDTYAYAFDDIQDGQKAARLVQNVVMSAYGMAFTKGDGTFRYLSRYGRATGSSAATFSNSMHGLSVPSSLDKVYNHVRVTIHPKTIDAAATTVLYAQTGTAPSIGAGASVTVWGNYRDPNNTLKLLGGLSMVTPIVATTDYTANSLADGSGSDLTANVSIVTTAFASSAKFVVTNNGAATAYLTKLQIRGKGVYDNGPRTFEAQSTQTYGDRPVDVDMPYQDNADIGQSAATFIEAQFRSPTQQIESIEFVANQSDTLMTQALTREPGDRITITETVTGVSAVDVVIQSVEFEVRPGLIVICRWGLAPTNPFNIWQLGIAGNSEIGASSSLGF